MVHKKRGGGKSYRRSIPPTSELIKSWTIYELVDDWIVHSRINPTTQILIYLLVLLGVGSVTVLVSMNIAGFPSVSFGVFVVIQLILLFVTIMLHELCHGVLIICYGGRPSFGIKWMNGLGPVVYVTTGGYYSLSAYKNIAAAPIVILSILSVIFVFSGYGWWVFIPFVFNAVGAAGDLLSLRVLHPLPAYYLIEDTKDGFNVYATTSHEYNN